MSILTFKGYICDAYMSANFKGFTLNEMFEFNKKSIARWKQEGAISTGEYFTLLIYNSALKLIFEGYRA